MSTPSPPSPIDPRLVEQFNENGFVVVPNFFADSDMDAMADAVESAVIEDQRGDRRILAERSRYEQSFLQCLYLWARHAQVAAWSAHPALGAAAAQLLGVDAVRIWHDQALFKEAGGRQTDAHQDHPYWPIIETDQVTAWIPLDGSTASAGATAYWPGSHRLGLDEFVNIFGDSDPKDIGDHEALRDVTPETLEVPRGSVAFHHGLTVHRAGANTTDSTRRVHTVIFMADGCRRSDQGGHPSVDIDGISPGEVIAGSLTPVVWPNVEQRVPRVPQSTRAALEAFRRARMERRLAAQRDVTN